MEDSSTWPKQYRNQEFPTDDLIGLKIDGRYLVQKLLGHGGVGAVYLACDTKLHDKLVVVKILLEKSARDQWVVQKFLQEKEALARVDHPGVVGILDTGELPNGKPYIVMQFIDGISLREAIKEAPEGMDLQHGASIIKQIGSALSAVHTKGIYHRDLKPENIMLQTLDRGTEQVKIVDFGIAKIRESVIAPSTVTGAGTAGTIIYMSPEQLHGIKVSAASDIYSFGVIVYEMVTGRRPFNPSTIAHLSDLQRQGIRVKPADLRPQLPVEAENVILRALAFDPKNRYEHAVDFGEALATALLNDEETLKLHRDALGETLVDSFEPSPAQPAKPSDLNPRKRWPRVAVGVALAVVLMVSLGLIGLLLSFGWQNIFARSDNINQPAVTSQRSLIYSLTVQKMRDDKPFQEPFLSSGQEIFESGYRFRLNVSSPQAGFLYVFNQSVDEQSGLTAFSSIYPTPKTSQGSAWLAPNSTVQTSWNTFGGRPDTERFWIIWSNSEITELEAAKNIAFNSSEGIITDVAINESVKQLFSRHSEPKPVTIKDTATKQTAVRAEGALLVKLLELEHR